MEIKLGFEEHDREMAATLYAKAFQRKFSRILGCEATVVALLRRGMNPEYCLCAYDELGELKGLAGFHIGKHSLIDLQARDFFERFGIWRGMYKALLSYVIFYRKPSSQNELLMDGIVVSEDSRGSGIGTRLFDALFLLAKERDYDCIRLDVIDENPKAKALYENIGFETTSYQKVPSFIARMIGVTGVTGMVKRLKN